MIIVLDTSAGVEIVLQKSQADVLGQHVTEADWVIAPALYIAEVSNVFWKYYRFTEMPLDRCEQAIDQAVAIPDEYVDEKTLYREAFALACLTVKPVYDMYFLVVARRYNAFLLTLDNSLRETAHKNSIRIL